MTSAAFVAAVGVIAAIIDLVGKLMDLAVARVTSRSYAPTEVRMVAIHGPPGQNIFPSARKLHELMFWYIITSILAVCIAILGAQTFLSDSELVGLLLVCEGLFLFFAGVQGFYRINKASPDCPLQAVSVDVELTGGEPQVLQDCLNAMVGIGAIKSTGTVICRGRDGDVTIQGGTGAWPRRARGNRVTINIGLGQPAPYIVRIKSETYRPALLDSYHNSRNTTRILQQIILSSNVKSSDRA
jgi:hypothetical protein